MCSSLYPTELAFRYHSIIFFPHQIISSSGRESHIAMRQYFKNNLVTHCPCLIGCQSFLFLRLIFPWINPLLGGGELKKHYSFYQVTWRESWTRVTSCPSLPRTEGVPRTWMGLLVLKPVESGTKWDDLGVLILVVTHISKWIFRIVVEGAEKLAFHPQTVPSQLRLTRHQRLLCHSNDLKKSKRERRERLV